MSDRPDDDQAPSPTNDQPDDGWTESERTAPEGGASPDVDDADGLDPAADPVEITELSPPPVPDDAAPIGAAPPPPESAPQTDMVAGPVPADVAASDPPPGDPRLPDPPGAPADVPPAVAAAGTVPSTAGMLFDQDARPRPTGWPGAAKAWVAVLALLFLAAGAVAVWAVLDANAAKDDVEELEARLVLAERRADDAEARLAQLEADGESTVGELTAERNAAIAARDAAIAERDAVIAEQNATAEELAEANAAVEELQGQLAEIVDTFPITIAPDLGATDTAGNYATSIRQVVCEGLPQCGSPPAIDNAVLARDPNGTLRLVAGNTLDVPLAAVDGAMFGIAESHDLVQPCNGVARDARVSVALYAAEGQLQFDGQLDLTDLDGSIVVEVFADECGSGFSWYHTKLTRS